MTLASEMYCFLVEFLLLVAGMLTASVSKARILFLFVIAFEFPIKTMVEAVSTREMRQVYFETLDSLFVKPFRSTMQAIKKKWSTGSCSQLQRQAVTNNEEV